MIDKIEKAKETVEIQMFIWRDDPLGERIGTALLLAAERGVSIKITKDMVGGGFEFGEETRTSFFHTGLPAYYSFMSWLLHLTYPVKGKPMFRRTGMNPVAVELLRHPNVILSYHKPLYDHSKYIIVDDEWLIVSGMNFEYKEWKHDLQGRPYHDFMMAFRSGDVVDDFRRMLTGNSRCRRYIGKDKKDGRIDFLMNRNGVYHMRKGLISRIAQARESVDIVMAYIGDEGINKALVAVARRGIKVTLYIPGKSNLQHDLNLFHIRHLLRESGNRIQVYFCKAMIHGKLIYIDRDYMTFGSANLNENAMELMGETNVGCFMSVFGHKTELEREIGRIQSDSVMVDDWKDIRYNPLMAIIENSI